jgi:hypothetical protein
MISDTNEKTEPPPPLTQREMAELACFHGAFGINHRALARLRWLEAEVAALKKADPLAEMWRELAEYQPQAYANGYGMCWMRMCEERTRSAAADAANPRVNSSAAARAAAKAAAGAAAYFEEAMKSAADAVAAIRRAKGAR